MYVKIYRYRIQPDKVGRYLEIQRQATVYTRDTFNYEISLLRSKEDPWEWTEIHRYWVKESFERASIVADSEPELKRLFPEFQRTMDPNDRGIKSESFQQYALGTIST